MSVYLKLGIYLIVCVDIFKVISEMQHFKLCIL